MISAKEACEIAVELIETNRMVFHRFPDICQAIEKEANMGNFVYFTESISQEGEEELKKLGYKISELDTDEPDTDCTMISWFEEE